MTTTTAATTTAGTMTATATTTAGATATTARLVPAPEGHVWYLCYGSNMNAKVLSGRRKVFPKRSVPVVVPGLQLAYNYEALPYLEPAFASVVAVDAGDEDDARRGRNPKWPTTYVLPSPLHGVAHLITDKEMLRIRLTEGGGGNDGVGYQLHETVGHPYILKQPGPPLDEAVSLVPTGEPVQQPLLSQQPLDYEPAVDTAVGIPCVTLMRAPVHTRFHRYPSLRYHTLLVDGAVQSGLAPSYVQILRDCGYFAPPSTVLQHIGRALMLAIGIPLAIPMFATFLAARVAGKRVLPAFMYSYTDALVVPLLFWLNDYVFGPIFGDGSRSTIGTASDQSKFK